MKFSSRGRALLHTWGAAAAAVVLISLSTGAQALTPAEERAAKLNALAQQRGNAVAAIQNFNVGTFTGTTVGGPTYNRGSGCTSLSGTGTATPYSVQAFTVPYAGAYGITSTQTGGWDGYIHLYEGSFNPASPLSNCIASNDDGAGDIGTSDIYSVALTPGTTYYLVTSGFENTDSGSFVNTVYAMFSLPVPTMSEAALGGTALAVLLLGLGFAARRRRFG